MRSFEEAEAFAEREKDPFYLAAFMFQYWLGQLVTKATAEYADKKNPKERLLQSGEGWRGFCGMFESKEENGYLLRLGYMMRFSLSDNSSGNSLRHALVPLNMEHQCTCDYFGDGNGAKSKQDLNDLARRTIERWCDWVDAAVHLRVHRLWHRAPTCFEPDPEARELALLGNAQRYLPRLDERARASWLWDFAMAAERFKDSPKWAVVGKAMAAAPADPETAARGGLREGNGSGPVWQYEDVDTLVIALWPLVKVYNWTYRDLLKTIKPGLKRPEAYPCDREQDFATYCANVLGLRKRGKGVSAKDGRPKGYDVALKYCPTLAGNEEKRV